LEGIVAGQGVFSENDGIDGVACPGGRINGV